MNKLLVVFLLLPFSSSIFAQSKDELQVRNILQIQAEAWNNGNINAYMETYWHSDSLMFIGKRGIVYGWEQTKNNYLRGYPDTVSMGKLKFELQEVKRLSVLYFFIAGKWHLTRTAGNLEGTFTLLIKRIGGKWVIVSDHSS